MLTSIENRAHSRYAETFYSAMLLAGCALAAWVACHHSFASDLVLAPFLFAGLLVIVLWLGLDRLSNNLHPGLRQVYCLVLACTSAGWLTLAAYLHTTGHDRLTGGPLRLCTALALSSMVFALLRFEVGLVSAQQRKSCRQRVLVLGSGARASVAWRELRTRHRDMVEFLGFVDDRSGDAAAPDIAHRLVSTVDGLREYLCHTIVDEIVIAAPMRSCYDMIEMVVQIADTAGIHVSGMRDSVGSQRRKERGRVRGMFQNVTVERRTQRLGQAAKRTLDVVGAATLIVLTAPLMLVIGLLVKATSPGPIFFVQSRVGLRRRTFPMFKFRSMIVGAHEQLAALEARNEAAGPLFKLSEDPRTTAFGRFLRRNSLDELPQLFNVLLGHMSLVGPRPMSLRDASHISHVSMIKRFTVKPGMTGMWQVQGRSSASLDQWIAMDARYVDQWTVGLDLQLLVMTVPAVLRRSGAM